MASKVRRRHCENCHYNNSRSIKASNKTCSGDDQLKKQPTTSPDIVITVTEKQPTIDTEVTVIISETYKSSIRDGSRYCPHNSGKRNCKSHSVSENKDRDSCNIQGQSSPGNVDMNCSSQNDKNYNYRNRTHTEIPHWWRGSPSHEVNIRVSCCEKRYSSEKHYVHKIMDWIDRNNREFKKSCCNRTNKNHFSRKFNNCRKTEVWRRRGTREITQRPYRAAANEESQPRDKIDYKRRKRQIQKTVRFMPVNNRYQHK